MRTAQQPNLSPDRTSVRGNRVCPTAVATEVLLLQPRGEVESSAAWPLFVMVVTEPTGTSRQPLFDLLDRRGHADEPLVVAVEAVWSVLDSANALLAMTVHAADPVPVDMRIVLPAAPVMDILDMVARGAPLGVTTRDRAERLRGRFDVQAALRDVMLLSCPPSATLTDIADAVRTAREV
ncbi:MAG: hypothetical protein WBA97_12270 [Actinophytocola sp.]|uniref:hypothetical protein n=1 Tax=Actinophytocola sp. TaxID=1872138 RepID=UPI003C763EC5